MFKKILLVSAVGLAALSSASAVPATNPANPEPTPIDPSLAGNNIIDPKLGSTKIESSESKTESGVESETKEEQVDGKTETTEAKTESEVESETKKESDDAKNETTEAEKVSDVESETKKGPLGIWGISAIAGSAAAVLALVTFVLVRKSKAKPKVIRRQLRPSPV